MPQDLPAAIARLSEYIKGLERIPEFLLVEDNEDDLLLFNKTLHAVGIDCKVVSTCSGEMAIENLKDRKFDLIFLDLRMVPVDGVQVLKKMKGMDITTPVVIMSGLSNGPLVNQAIELGAWLHLRKPVQLEQLKSMLTKVKI